MEVIKKRDIALKDLKKELMGIEEIPITVKGISHFDNDNRPYDVVKFDLESEHLHNLNKQFN